MFDDTPAAGIAAGSTVSDIYLLTVSSALFLSRRFRAARPRNCHTRAVSRASPSLTGAREWPPRYRVQLNHDDTTPHRVPGAPLVYVSVGKGRFLSLRLSTKNKKKHRTLHTSTSELQFCFGLAAWSSTGRRSNRWRKWGLLHKNPHASTGTHMNHSHV